VFKLTAPATADAAWTFGVIWQFTGGAYGGNPSEASRLVMDMSGALYGTTTRGGAHGSGTVFQLTPTEAGYSLTTIWRFPDPHPLSSLPFKSGNLFGSTYYGGPFGVGPGGGDGHERR